MTLGMTDAFVDADFSGMDGTRDLAIQAVLHKGFISVDELAPKRPPPPRSSPAIRSQSMIRRRSLSITRSCS